MGKTYRFGDGARKNMKKNAKRFPELLNPRVFYGKISDTKKGTRNRFEKKRRTTYK